MDFEKKLVILSGKTGQGTVLLERNGMGTFVTVNAFSLPDLTAGEYALGVKTGQTVFRREIGSLGRIKSRFALPEGDYTAVHFVLFRTYDEEVVLYGTSEARKMWDANVMDGLRRNGLEKKTTSDAHAAVAATAQEFRYSERKIEDYFLEIDPARYHDTAVAEVNYFDYGKRGGEPQNGYYDAPAAPSDLERRYLRARFTRPQAPAQTASVQEEAPAPAFAPEPPPAADPPKIKSASAYTVEEAVAAVKTEAGFYATVKPQLDDLFTRGERFAPLESALPGTRWVKVDYDTGGRYYVVGLIGAAPDYIAYGVPGKYGAVPPVLEGADFVPLHAETPTGDGFWVLFQSAENGKEIRKAP